ncbi:MAG: nuclear transport factor 2 family protein [Bacteroidota bacterium]
MRTIIPILLTIFFIACETEIHEADIRAEILIHGETIRNAFAEGDVEAIKALHHPKVTKALGYNNLQKGREEVIEGVSQTLENFRLKFIENEVESIYLDGEVAIEQSRFAIQGTPKEGGDSFIFKGRTMVTYIRYEESPTGWATIREIIQPFEEP